MNWRAKIREVFAQYDFSNFPRITKRTAHELPPLGSEEFDFTEAHWGHAVHWTSDRHVCGHSRRRPKDGDVLWIKLRSGAVGMYQVSNVGGYVTPPDMWHADVKLIGYRKDYQGDVVRYRNGALL